MLTGQVPKTAFQQAPRDIVRSRPSSAGSFGKERPSTTLHAANIQHGNSVVSGHPDAVRRREQAAARYALAACLAVHELSIVTSWSRFLAPLQVVTFAFIVWSATLSRSRTLCTVLLRLVRDPCARFSAKYSKLSVVVLHLACLNPPFSPGMQCLIGHCTHINPVLQESSSTSGSRTSTTI